MIVINIEIFFHSQWHQAWRAKEEAIKSRIFASCEELERGSRELTVLREGDKVWIQNQNRDTGRENKWDRQGTVIAVKDNDQFLVKVHGSGRLTLRNRKFLRKFELENYHDQQVTAPAFETKMTGAKEPIKSQPQKTSAETELPAGEFAPDEAIHQLPLSYADVVLEQPNEDRGRPSPQRPAAIDVPLNDQALSPHDVPSPKQIVNEMTPPATSPRRSNRTKVQRQVYDANTGTFVKPSH